MPRSYKRNGYVPKGLEKDEKSEWLDSLPDSQTIGPVMRGITDRERQERLVGDVYGKDSTGLVDAVGDLATVTPPGMMISSIGEAGEEIRKDPTKVRSYLEAVRRFGESGAADLDKGGAVSDAMIPTAQNIEKFRKEMQKRLPVHPSLASRGDVLRSYLEVRRPVLTGSGVGFSPENKLTEFNLPMEFVEKGSTRIPLSNIGLSETPFSTQRKVPSRRDSQAMADGKFGMEDISSGALLPRSEAKTLDKSLQKYLKPYEDYRRGISQPLVRYQIDTDKMADIATHELTHGAQKFREPGMFLDYPRDPERSLKEYYNHPAEVQARKAGITGKNDWVKFQRQFVPPDKAGQEAYGKLRDEFEAANPYPQGLSAEHPARKDWSRRLNEFTGEWPGMYRSTQKWLEEGYEPSPSIEKGKGMAKSASSSSSPALPSPEARNWITPKGETIDMGDIGLDDAQFQFHEDWIEDNYKGPTREAIRDGYIRESDNTIRVWDPADPKLSAPLRRAAKEAHQMREPVFVRVKDKEYSFTPQELNEAYFNLSDAIANQASGKRKYKSSSASGKGDF